MASEEPEEAAEAPPAAAARENAQQPPPTPPQGSATSNERPTPPSTPPQGSAAPEAPPSEPEAVTTDAPPKPHEDWRVKVYRLNDEGQWDDRGTGRVSLAGARVRVVSEAPAQPRDVLLSSVPRGPSPVSRQGENILTWDACRGDDGLALAGDQRSLRNGETACVALSFQEARGCEAVLAKLLFAIAARPASPPHDDPGPPGADPSSLEPRPETVAEDESASHARAFLAHVLGARGAGVASALETAARRAPLEWRALPTPAHGVALDEWACTLARAATSLAAKERYAATLLADDALLLRQFTACFDDAEDADDVETLRKLADVAKLVVLLNEPPLVEALLDRPLFEPFLGALEYAADLKRRPDASVEVPPESPLRQDRQNARQAIADCGEDESDDGNLERRNTLDSNATREALSGEPRTAKAARRVPLRHLALRASQMREVLPITDPVLKARVVQNFRATVLREASLRPGMDESQFGALHALVFHNNNDILRRLHVDTDYLQRIVDLAGGAPVPDDLKSDLDDDNDEVFSKPRLDALRFLREMVALSRNAQPSARDALYRHLFVEADLYGALAAAFADCGASAALAPSSARQRAARLCCAEVVTTALRVDAASLRRDSVARPPPAPPAWYAKQANKASEGQPAKKRARLQSDTSTPCLFGLLRCLALHDNDAATRLHAADACRLVLDAGAPDDSEGDEFLAEFYEHYMPWLVEPLYDCGVDGDKVARGPACAYACEILAHCVRAHRYRMKYFVLRHNVAGRVVTCLEAAVAVGDKPLQLAALRFVRACVGAKDDFYARYLVKNGSLAPVLKLLASDVEVAPTARLQPGDSLVTSAVAELAEFVRAENVKGLVAHLVEQHSGALSRSSTHRPLLEGLETRHAQNRDLVARAGRSATNDEPSQVQRERRARITAEDEAEAYFDDDDDDDLDDGSSDDDASAASSSDGSSSVDSNRSPLHASAAMERRLDKMRSGTPPTEDDSSDEASSDGSRGTSPRRSPGRRRAKRKPPLVGVAPSTKKRREDSSVSSDSSDDDDSFRPPQRPESPMAPVVFGGGAGRFASPAFGRHAPAPLVVKKIEWSPDRAAAADGFARAASPPRPPTEVEANNNNGS